MRSLLYSLMLLWAACAMLCAQGTTVSPPVPAPPPTAAGQNAPEMATRDEPTSFQAKVNKDETLQRLGQGVTVRTSFDVKPGAYLIRLVVRDAEERKLSATNGAVQIQRGCKALSMRAIRSSVF